MNAKYTKALEMATTAHLGQVDEAGNDYINRPVYIAEHCRSVNEKLVALLQDTLKMTALTVEDIRSNFGSTVSDAVVAVTYKDGEEMADYLRRIKANPIARAVKIEEIKYRIDVLGQTNGNYETTLNFLQS